MKSTGSVVGGNGLENIADGGEEQGTTQSHSVLSTLGLLPRGTQLTYLEGGEKK